MLLRDFKQFKQQEIKKEQHAIPHNVAMLMGELIPASGMLLNAYRGVVNSE